MNIENMIDSFKEKYLGIRFVDDRQNFLETTINRYRKTLVENIPIIQSKNIKALHEMIDTDLYFKNISGNKEIIIQHQEKHMALAREIRFFNELLMNLDNNLYLGFPKDDKLAGFIAQYDHDTLAEVMHLDSRTPDNYICTAKHLNRAANYFKNLLDEKYNHSDFDILMLCKEVSQVFILTKKPEKCEVAGDSVNVTGNLESVYEALFNIGKNGIYHGNNKIKFLTENHNDYAVIKIRDAGQGIDRKDRSKVKQMGVSLKGYGNGYGLGIATYAIETVNNGLITFRRSHDPEYKGNEARIFLPKNNSFNILRHYFNARDRILD